MVDMTSLEFEYNVKGMDDSGNVTKDGQQDVDEQVSIAAALEENTQRREDDGEDDLADIAGGERHVGGCVCVLFWFGLVVW